MTSAKIPAKIGPCDPTLSEEEAKKRGLLTVNQEVAIQRLISEPTKSILIGDETGFGKTVQGVEAIIRAGWKRTLIIALPISYPQWAERLSLQSDGELALRVVDSTKAGQVNYAAMLAGEDGIFAASIAFLNGRDYRHQNKREKVDGKWVVQWAVDKKTNEVKLRDRKEGKIGPAREPVAVRERVHLFTFRDKMKAPLDALIFDEAHAVCKHTSIQRRTLLTFKTEWKIAMSATWSGNSFEFAWSLPRWLWPDLIPPYWEWHERWCRMEPTLKDDGTPAYANGKALKHVAGEVEPAGTFIKTLPAYIRNESGDLAPAPFVVECDPTLQQLAQRQDLEADLMTWVMNYEGEEEPLVINAPGSLYGRMRQLALAELSYDERGEVTFAQNAASAKLGPLRGLLDNRYAGRQVGILTDSKVYAKFVAARMNEAGYPTGLITGDTKKSDRLIVKDAFIAGEYRYLIGTVQSMGTALDGLQTATNKVIWLSQPDGNPSQETQAIGRYFRTGRMMEADGSDGFEQVIIQVTGFEEEAATMQRLVSKAFALKSSIGKDALHATLPLVH